MIANYDGEILHVDRRVGDVLERLDALGALENAHVIFCSDHGEEFADHHGWAHVNSIYEEIAACPLAYRPPGGVAGGRVIERPVGVLDVVRTAIALLGLDAPPLHQGELIPELLGSRVAARERPVLCAMPPNLFSLRLGRWKLLRRGTSADPVWRLFDMSADPRERGDLALVYPDTVSLLRGYLDGMIASQSLSSLDEIGSTADPELLRQLKNLGYVR
jgi:arylsulfatase A-like enzyme